MIKTLIILLTLVAIAFCSLNLNDIESLFEESSTDSHLGRLMLDPSRNRLFFTGVNVVHYVDTKTKKLISIPLTKYASLSGEFLDDNGQYYVFASPTLPTGLTLISIDTAGKYTEKPLANLKTLGCVVYKSDPYVFLTTKQGNSSIIAAYDYRTDNITGGFKMIEDYGDNDCLKYKDTALFSTSNFITAVDMTNTRIINHQETKVLNQDYGFNRLSLDTRNAKLYVTWALFTNVIQYDVNSRKISIFKGDSDQFSGFLGLATHPHDGSAYFFTGAIKKASQPTVSIIETDVNLESSNSLEVPNGIFFVRRGHFDLDLNRLYILGYSGDSGHLHIYSIGMSTPWYQLSLGWIIGLSVGGGILLLLLISGIAASIYYSRRQRYTAEEKATLMGSNTYISSTA
jgi:hypothetical protein